MYAPSFWRHLSAVRELIGDIGGKDYSSSAIGHLLNVSLAELSRETNWTAERIVYMNSVASDNSYPLPQRTVRITSVRYNGYNVSRCNSQAEWDQLTEKSSATAAYPTLWWQIGRYLYLWPTPTSAVTNGIELRVKRRLNKMEKWSVFTPTLSNSNAAATILIPAADIRGLGYWNGCLVEVLTMRSAVSGQAREGETAYVDETSGDPGTGTITLDSDFKLTGPTNYVTPNGSTDNKVLFSDYVELPDEYQDAAVYFAAAQCVLMSDKPDKYSLADRLGTQYESMKIAAIREAAKNRNVRPGFVTNDEAPISA